MNNKTHTAGRTHHTDDHAPRHGADSSAGRAALGHSASAEVGELRDELSTLRENVRESAHTIAEGGVRVARSAGAALRHTAEDVSHEGSVRLKKATKSASKAIADHPFTAVGIAALAGVALSGGYFMLRRRGR